MRDFRILVFFFFFFFGGGGGGLGILGFRVCGLRCFWVQGFRVLGFRGLEFRAQGLRNSREGCLWRIATGVQYSRASAGLFGGFFPILTAPRLRAFEVSIEVPCLSETPTSVFCSITSCPNLQGRPRPPNPQS